MKTINRTTVNDSVSTHEGAEAPETIEPSNSAVKLSEDARPIGADRAST